MTPGERVVVQAAINLVRTLADKVVTDPYMVTLEAAVGALQAERDEAGHVDEMDLTWGQVVESDEIWNAKVKKWYTVIRTVAQGNGMIKLNVKGIPNAIERDAKDQTRVRRGTTGQAADVFATVLWSSQARPEPHSPKEEE